MERTLFGRTFHIPLNGLSVSRRLEFSLLMKYLDLKGSELLLDVACGDGYWTAKMIPRAAGIVGFDFNFKRLQQALKLAAGLRGAVRCDAHILPFQDESFDCSVGVCVLEHFERDVEALSELRRVMKPGGTLALTVDSFSYPGVSEEEKARHARNFSVVHHYKINDLKKKLGEAGFEATKWSYLLKSPVAASFYRFTLKHPKLAYFIFPISYPLSLWSERLSRNQSCGYKLAVAARAL
jgi:ubiquinone/menaquinone biosynthesis C-methylase UbiE